MPTPQSRRFAGLLSALVVVSACSSQSAPTAPTLASTVNAISITPGVAFLDSGTTLRFTAEVRNSDGTQATGLTVVWATNSSAVVQVSPDGTVTALRGGTATVTATAGGYTGSATVNVRDVFNVDESGVPMLITSDYIDLSQINRISRFRSGFGHDYSDSSETCRSMKHYFMPRGNVDWSAVTISAPADGVVLDIREEGPLGFQVAIRSSALGAATIVLFHVVLDEGVSIGTTVTSGMRLGRHIGPQTMSDVAIRLDTPGGPRLVSYFDAMTDAMFARYQARGVPSRAALTISRNERDADPLSCSGQQFVSGGTLSHWVGLN